MKILTVYSIILVSMFIIASIVALKKSKTEIEKRTNIGCIILLLPILIVLLFG